MTIRTYSIVPEKRATVRRVASLLMVACQLSSGAQAMAQQATPSEVGGSPEPSSANQSARGGVAEATTSPGRESSTGGSGEESCLSSKQAHLEHGAPNTLVDYVLCEQAVGHNAKALALLNSFVGELGSALTDERRALLQRLQDDSRAQVTSITIEVTVPEAEVWLDGESVGKTPIAQPVIVDRGAHRLRVERQGYRVLEENCLVAGGAASHLRLTLEPLMGRAELRVEAEESGAISIDGRPVGVGSWQGPLEAGSHTVGVVRAEHRQQTVVKLSEGSLTTLASPAPTPGASSKVDGGQRIPRWLYTVAGVALVAGSGVAAYLLTHRDSNKPSPTGEPAIPLGWSF